MEMHIVDIFEFLTLRIEHAQQEDIREPAARKIGMLTELGALGPSIATLFEDWVQEQTQDSMQTMADILRGECWYEGRRLAMAWILRQTQEQGRPVLPFPG